MAENQAPASSDAKPTQVETLPKGQERAMDGTIILKNGEHTDLESGNYYVHGAKLKLEGAVFVAQKNVNWIPARKCVCKADRPEAVQMKKQKSSDTIIVTGTCSNESCQFNGIAYIWIHDGDAIKF